MNVKTKIRKLNLQDLNEFKDIRLEMLRNHPENYGSSFEEESAFPDSMWESRLSKKHVKTIGVFEEKLMGIVLVVKNPRSKMKHIANINSMYVRPEFRGKGVGKLLIEEALKTDTEIVRLSVVSTNRIAINLYKKMGFKKYAEERKTIKLNEKYHNLILMEKEVI